MNPHSVHSASPVKLVHGLWHQRALIRTLTKQLVTARYKGSLFGVFWTLLQPLLMLSVFTFVFGEIFQSRWSGSTGTGKLDFATALFSGLLIYNLLTECISRSSTLIQDNTNYVKKVIFPLEILSIATVLSALFHFLVAFLTLLVLLGFSNWTPSVHAIYYVPLIIACYTCLILGASWALSAIGVFLRDTSQFVAPILTAIMFLSPIFYPLSSVPAKTLWLFRFNPVTFPIEQTRNVLLYDAAPDWLGFIFYSVVCIIVLMCGFYLFQKTRRGFADVI